MLLFGRLIAGALLLLFGRRLFWFYVAAIGFAAGMTIATQVFHVDQEWVTLLIGLAFGLGGALLAYFLQKAAIGVVGFLAGAYILATVISALSIAQGSTMWIIYIVGGIIGVILMTQLFDLAIIILSALAGASLVVEALRLTGTVSLLAAIGLFIVGLVAQFQKRPSE